MTSVFHAGHQRQSSQAQHVRNFCHTLLLNLINGLIKMAISYFEHSKKFEKMQKILKHFWLLNKKSQNSLC